MVFYILYYIISVSDSATSERGALTGLGELPSEIWGLHCLKDLHIRNNFLADASFKADPGLAQLSSLELLDVSFNHLSRLPKGLGSLAALKHLFCSWNRHMKIEPEGSPYVGSTYTADSFTGFCPCFIF
jgi:Leucine-rich repeat (LRR) protein